MSVHVGLLRNHVEVDTATVAETETTQNCTFAVRHEYGKFRALTVNGRGRMDNKGRMCFDHILLTH